MKTLSGNLTSTTGSVRFAELDIFFMANDLHDYLHDLQSRDKFFIIRAV